MSRAQRILVRHLLPLFVSAAALVYVFGYAIDWEAIPEATDRANVPLFLAITVLDKIVFFLAWAWVQASMVRRFLAPVPIRQIVAVRGGAELVRAVNHSVSDAAFFLGIWQLSRAPLQSVVAVATLPFVAHFFVLLVQATVALGFASPERVRVGAIAGAVVFGWSVVAAFVVARALGATDRLWSLLRLDFLQGRVNFAELRPYLGFFAAFAILDVLIQGLASRAFGNAIEWTALFAGIPVLYLTMMLPSFGNFGTREIVWAGLFHGYAEEASLYAFALWTNVVFLVMHVIIGGLFLNRAVALLADLRRTRDEVESVRQPILRDALDP